MVDIGDVGPRVQIKVCPCKGNSFDLILAVSPSLTCADVLECVTECAVDMGRCDAVSKWVLVEKWNGAEKKLLLGHFIQSIQSWSSSMDSVIFIAREKKLSSQISPQPAKTGNINQLCKLLKKQQEEVRRLRLLRAKKGLNTAHDPDRRGLQLMATLSSQFETLATNNKQLAAEVSKMNHEATRLTEHLTALRRASQDVIDSLTQLKAQNQVKQEKEAKEKEKELKRIKESISQVQQELEKRQRMSELQDSKIKLMQNNISGLQGTLKLKKRELEQMKEWAKEKKQRQIQENNQTTLLKLEMPSAYTVPVIVADTSLSDTQTNKHEDIFLSGDSNASFESNSSYGSTLGGRRKRRESTVSLRRRFADFEEKTQRLLEEEGKTFREATNITKPSHILSNKYTSLPYEETDGSSPVTLISPSSITTQELSPHLSGNMSPSLNMGLSLQSYSQTDSPLLNSFHSTSSYPRTTRKQMEVLSVPSTKDQRKGRQGILKRSDKNRKTKRVIFSPEAIILNAAWEGDLELTKQCIRQIGGYNVVSGLGATCLHNAVCSGSIPLIEYLIQLGCDVNIQDYEGWTPLHCAAAYCNIAAIKLLIKNGASIFIRTVENMSPVEISKEEMEEQKKEESILCYHYLKDYSQQMGEINDKVLFALFSYVATGTDELSFVEGERLVIIQKHDGWWEAENTKGLKGLVPSLYLGLHSRYHIIL